jgi:hypothetical protein
MTTTRPAFSTITVSYRLSTTAAEQLGDDALSVYETALTAALEAEYPGAEVDVDVRLASSDESSFDATCETDDGLELKVWTRGAGGIEVGADPDELDFAAQEAIREDFRHADGKAWQAACESA